jgi:hypothetical protein
MTQTISVRNPCGWKARGSVRRASGLVQEMICKLKKTPEIQCANQAKIILCMKELERKQK